MHQHDFSSCSSGRGVSVSRTRNGSRLLEAAHCNACLLHMIGINVFEATNSEKRINALRMLPHPQTSQAERRLQRCYQFSLQSLSHDRATKNNPPLSNSDTEEQVGEVITTFESPPCGASHPSRPPALSLALFPQLSSPKVRKKKTRNIS